MVTRTKWRVGDGGRYRTRSMRNFYCNRVRSKSMGQSESRQAER